MNQTDKTRAERPEFVRTMGVFAYLVLVSVSGLVTTEMSYQLIVVIRAAAIATVVASILVLLLLYQVRITLLISVLIFTGAILYGLLMSHFNGASKLGAHSIVVDYLIAISGIILFGINSSGPVVPEKTSKLFVVYALSMFACTFVVGGVVFEFPPHYVFEHASAQIGREETYSLGISSFYGYAAIIVGADLAAKGGLLSSALRVILLLLLIGLSLLGGGRGESLIALGLAGLIMAAGRPIVFVGLVVIIVTGLSLYIGSWSDLSDSFVLLQRLSLLFDGDLSSRDVLVKQAIDLLIDEPICAFIGCGLGYFQYRHGYDFSTYPHNSIVESVISFGLPLTVVMLTLALVGLISYAKGRRKGDYFLAYFAYALLVSLKSGYFMGSWLLLACLTHLASLAVARLIRYEDIGHAELTSRYGGFAKP